MQVNTEMQTETEKKIQCDQVDDVEYHIHGERENEATQEVQQQKPWMSSPSSASLMNNSIKSNTSTDPRQAMDLNLPCILHLDSLNMHNPKIIGYNIKMYICGEWYAKHSKDYTKDENDAVKKVIMDMKIVKVTVPIQPEWI